MAEIQRYWLKEAPDGGVSVTKSKRGFLVLLKDHQAALATTRRAALEECEELIEAHRDPPSVGIDTRDIHRNAVITALAKATQALIEGEGDG